MRVYNSHTVLKGREKKSHPISFSRATTTTTNHSQLTIIPPLGTDMKRNKRKREFTTNFVFVILELLSGHKVETNKRLKINLLTEILKSIEIDN
jgi:hypothetical protein